MCICLGLDGERVRQILSNLSPGTLSPQYVSATARLSLRGTNGAAGSQVQEVLIRLNAPFSVEDV